MPNIGMQTQYDQTQVYGSHRFPQQQQYELPMNAAMGGLVPLQGGPARWTGTPSQISGSVKTGSAVAGGKGSVPSQKASYAQAITGQVKTEIILEWTEEEKYCTKCRGFAHHDEKCGKKYFDDKQCTKCKQYGHPEWDCLALKVTGEDRIWRVTRNRVVHSQKNCDEEECKCMVCGDMNHCEINCAKQESEEMKCKTCHHRGHNDKNCTWKYEIKGFARVDRVSEMMKIIRETTIFSNDEGTMKTRDWNKKVAHMKSLTTWLDWFLEEGQRVFWIGCVTVIRNNPELANELQMINSAIDYVARKLQFKRDIWKMVMSKTEKYGDYKEEREEFQKDLKLYFAASELWNEVCNKMRANEPRYREWNDVYETKDEDDLTYADFSTRVLKFTVVAEEADYDEDMASFLPCWIMGKFSILVYVITAGRDTQPWENFWSLLKETILFLEHCGLDEAVGPRMIWFNIADRKDKERIYVRGHNLFQRTIKEAIERMDSMRDAVKVALEGVGLMWMWTWIFVATPLAMPVDVAEAMVSTHNKIEEITITITNTFYKEWMTTARKKKKK